MVLYFRIVHLDLPKIFALFWTPVLSRHGEENLTSRKNHLVHLWPTSFIQANYVTPPPPHKIFPVRRWGYISCFCCFPLADLTHIIMYKLNSGKLRVNGPFLESPENVSGLYKSYFMLAVFAFKIKVSITLKVIQWKYRLTKQNWPVCELGVNYML